MPGQDDAQSTVRALIEAFGAADIEGMRPLLADDLRAYVTNAEGGTDAVVGADEYLARMEAMDLPSAEFRIELTQLVEPNPGQVLAMVEINASRGERRLHNHAAHLLSIIDGLVAEWWMVEAVPAESDAFWSQ